MILFTIKLHSKGNERPPTPGKPLATDTLQSLSCKCGCGFPGAQHEADPSTDFLLKPMPFSSFYYDAV
jgi:hypothetical protein